MPSHPDLPSSHALPDRVPSPAQAPHGPTRRLWGGAHDSSAPTYTERAATRMLDLVKQAGQQGVVPWNEIRQAVQQGSLAGIDVLLSNPPHPWPAEMASWAPSIWGSVTEAPVETAGQPRVRLFRSSATSPATPTDVEREMSTPSQNAGSPQESGLQPHVQGAWDCWDAVLERIAALQESGPAHIHPLLVALWASPLMGITPGQPWDLVAKDLAPGPQRDRIRAWGTRLASLTEAARAWLATRPMKDGELEPEAARQVLALAAASPSVAQQTLVALPWLSRALAEHLIWAQPTLRLESLLGRLDDAPTLPGEPFAGTPTEAAPESPIDIRPDTRPEPLNEGPGGSFTDGASHPPEDVAWDRTCTLLQQAADPAIWPLPEPQLRPAPQPIFRSALQKYSPFPGDFPQAPRPAGLTERLPDEWWALLIAIGSQPARRDSSDQSALAQYLAQPSAAAPQEHIATLRALSAGGASPFTASRGEPVIAPRQKPNAPHRSPVTPSPHAIPHFLAQALRRDRLLGWEVLREDTRRDRLLQGLTHRIRKTESDAAASTASGPPASLPADTPAGGTPTGTPVETSAVTPDATPLGSPQLSEKASGGAIRWVSAIEASLEPWLGYLEEPAAAPAPQELDVTGRLWRPSPRAQQTEGKRTASLTLQAWKHLIQSLGSLLIHSLGTPGRELFPRLALGHPGETHQVAWPNLAICARDSAVPPSLLWSAWERLLRGRVMGAHQMALTMPQPWPSGVQPLLATAIGERLRVLSETAAQSPHRINPVMIEALPYLSSPVRSVGATLIALQDGAWPQASGGIAMAQHPLAGRDPACRGLLAGRNQPPVWAALICADPHAPDVEKLLHDLLAAGEDGVGGLQQVEAHAPELLTTHLAPSHFGPLLASTNAESRLWAIRQIGSFAR